MTDKEKEYFIKLPVTSFVDFCSGMTIAEVGAFLDELNEYWKQNKEKFLEQAPEE